MQQPPVRHYGAEPQPSPEGTERDGTHRASGFLPDERHGSAPTAALVTDQTTDHVKKSWRPLLSMRSIVGPPLYLHEQLRDHQVANLPEHFDLLPLHCFTDHLYPPSSPLGRSTTLHLKFGTVSGHPQDRRTLVVVIGVA